MTPGRIFRRLLQWSGYLTILSVFILFAYIFSFDSQEIHALPATQRMVGLALFYICLLLSACAVLSGRMINIVIGVVIFVSIACVMLGMFKS